MNLNELLGQLGYEGSPQFLRRGDQRFETIPGYGHIFRHGEDKPLDHRPSRWRVEGVYGVCDPEAEPERFVPVVYVCKADDESVADELHPLVWNQDVVPYVLVHTPKGVKAYDGFHFNSQGRMPEQQGVLRALTAFDQVQSIIELFHAKEVDTGKLWQNPHLQVDPSRRVYHRLLGNLRELGKWLRGPGGLTPEIAHALIGKYVYLRYLRDRGILSNKRLEEWHIKEVDIFGRAANRTGLEAVTVKLEGWLNGEIFPLPLTGQRAPQNEHIQRVAATFAGDDIGDASWQLYLDFQHYNFSYIPIETLSLIYEQFLHAEDDDAKKTAAKGEKSKARKAGAYYTPLPLVNFMLAELEEHRPLQAGMKVFDPSCGSGAFLVQAYRRLVEKTYPATGPRPNPRDVRELLEKSIFGVDVDGDACQVTQLSLLLTLLDYVDPPDLTKYPSFKLPTLREKNIFEGNFFSCESRLRAALGKGGADWIIGNPPWKQLKAEKLDDEDKPVWKWIGDNAPTKPVGMYQAAQVFAWEAPRYLALDGECALLVPAMGLFEDPSAEFRKKFFRHFQVHTVANFANLAEVLFDGRSRVPAAALSYRLRPAEQKPSPDEPITTYSPFVVNQEATRPLEVGERKKLWSLVVNGSEVRTLDLEEVCSGSGLPWKLAMWGTPWDERLIRRLETKWDSVRTLEEQKVIAVSEGPQIREFARRKSGSAIVEAEEAEELNSRELADLKFEKCDDLVGKSVLKVNALKGLRDVFSLPKDAVGENRYRYVCLIHGRGGLEVCEPPHVLVSAARNFAIYSEDYIIVPPRQLGVISPASDKMFLKALGLYLSSDFTFYHQFLCSSQAGIKRDVATLEALRQLPLPLAQLSRADLKEWVDLHSRLVKFPPRPLHREDVEVGQTTFPSEELEPIAPLLRQLNSLTAQVLGLDDRERALVHDLVRVRFALNDGKRGPEAMTPPSIPELRAYASRLKTELDDFIAGEGDRLHRVTVICSDDSAAVEVDFTRDHKAAEKVEVQRASSEEARAFQETRKRLLEKHAQWVYFNRNLRLYRGHQTYLFKPLHRFHWTESAAMMDASDLIAETLTAPTA